MKLSIKDRIACLLGIWALRRLYGADCETDVRDDFPEDSNAQCHSCDAKRLVDRMESLKND